MVTYESLKHIYPTSSGLWRVVQPHSDEVLRTNLCMLGVALIFVIGSAEPCLQKAGEVDLARQERITDVYCARVTDVFDLEGTLQGLEASIDEQISS